MKRGDLVSFQQEEFFEGAVQLRWLTERPEQAQLAANAFVFHGPHYHGAANAEAEGIEGGYLLKDSASFLQELLRSIQSGLRGEECNPYWLVVAGYGSGKSHLALTCASLLTQPRSATTQAIIANVHKVDAGLGAAIQRAVDELARPALVIALDGMSGFHLGNALVQSTLTQLALHGVDAGAIRALSPRFQLAEQFVERNFAFRSSRFAAQLPGLSADAIAERLRAHDEEIYTVVDSLYHEANGSPIPVTGQESAQELLDTLCDVYCGVDGYFSSVVILFDEFGRYLEYVAEKPLLAGDAALQQVFQGVQDNSDKIRFIGFTQYELKSYMQRFGNADLRQLQRYISRFDAAQKWFLSTNLETLFAHMIGKKQPLLNQVWQETHSAQSSETTRQLMHVALPATQKLPVWRDAEQFSRVIAEGCWPLHPLATWFLTRQKDVVQSRSAMTFVKEMLERSAAETAVVAGRLRQVSAAELVLHSMLPEMIAAERATGSVVAETLQLLLEKFQAHLTPHQRFALAGVAILERMRVGKVEQASMNRLLAEACALPLPVLESALHGLSDELGAIEWNSDLGQYELISDASTRGQFQQWLRQQQLALNAGIIRDLFMRRAIVDLGLDNLVPAPDFAQKHNIDTPDWQFKTHVAHSQNIDTVIASAFTAWKQTVLPTDMKGNVIYLYMSKDDDLDALETKIKQAFQKELDSLTVSKAPIWVIGLKDGGMSEHIGRLYLFDEQMNVADQERFRRFTPEERERSADALKDQVRTAIQQRLFWIAGFDQLPEGRLKQVGDAIFTQVYPQVIPFRFDGFGSANGQGPKDCVQLTRNLITRQVNVAWIQGQPKPIQNRTTTLLRQWGCLRASSERLEEPTAPSVLALYKHLREVHQQNPNRTLAISYQMLLAPPYGMNAASAGMLLGLLLAVEVIPPRIECEGGLIAASDWLDKAFSARRGANFFDTKVLEKSAIHFITGGALERWRQLLNKWEAEKQYDAILRIAAEVDQNRKIEPLPESLEGTYLYLRDRSEEILQKLHVAQKELESRERGMERAERQNDVDQLLNASFYLLRQQATFEKEGCWPAKLIDECGKLLGIVRELVAHRIAGWIPRQGCNSCHQVDDYSTRVEHAVKNLTALGLKTEAQQLTKLKDESIHKCNERAKYEYLLRRSNECPLQPEPADATPVEKLRAELKEGDDLVAGLRQLTHLLKPEEITARITAIQQRQALLKSKEQRHTKALGELYSIPLTSVADIENALVLVRRLQDIFIGTRDAGEVNSLKTQLERVIADVSVWTVSEAVSVERLTDVLKYHLQEQLPKLEAFLDEQEIDPAWNMPFLYQILIDEQLEAARQRSSAWLSPRLLSREEIAKLDINHCASLERELQAAPGYLSDTDQHKVTEIYQLVVSRRAEQEEDARSKQVNTWLASFQTLQNMTALSKAETEQWLTALRKPPNGIKPDEIAVLQPVETQLTAHLDQMSLDEIIIRIERLSVKAQRKLVLLLSERLMEQQDA
jgi:hypothetical protein